MWITVSIGFPLIYNYSVNRHRSWTSPQLREAVKTSTSIRQVISKLGLVPAGGNYVQISKAISDQKLDTAHFKGQGWNKGIKVLKEPIYELKDLLVSNSHYSLYRLKQRLFKIGLKKAKCEECGWARMSADGRIPIELDHINGNRYDNRIANLRILCPNCHSMKPTHRGRNKGVRRGGEMVDTRRLKRCRP